MLQEVPSWRLSDGRLVRELRCKDFAEALALLHRIGDVAEAEGHHPDLHLTGFRNLRVELSTHSVGGLSENDFILAAKVERLLGTQEARPDAGKASNNTGRGERGQHASGAGGATGVEARP